MFKLSKAVEYAIRGLEYLAMNREKKVYPLNDMAKQLGIPQGYLAKLFQELAKKGFVRSYRGPSGGFMLAKSPEDITLFEIIESIEGPIYSDRCIIKSLCPKDKNCPVYNIWKKTQKVFLDCLKSYTLEDMVKIKGMKGIEG
ncbi:MAG: Rrf2 family transcriptional regulator [Deltaproteobacteria bacterium]|nr:Rrf2 family transcriptional regulator [Deltaproteobacteria bacterium]